DPTERGRDHDLKVGSSDGAEIELLYRGRPSLHYPVRCAREDRGRTSVRAHAGSPGGFDREAGDGRAAVDQHACINAIERDVRPEVAIGRHPDPGLLPDNVLAAEPNALNQRR